jgi:hypothetical protein
VKGNIGFHIYSFEVSLKETSLKATVCRMGGAENESCGKQDYKVITQFTPACLWNQQSGTYLLSQNIYFVL